jgi:hypothetical protein
MGVLSLILKRDPKNWDYTEKLYVIDEQGICIGCFYNPLPESMTHIKCSAMFDRDYSLARASILSDEMREIYNQQIKETENVRN